MQVLLRQDVDKLGKRGEVVDVSDGYARNFLLPRRIAVPPTPAATRDLERDLKLASVREARKQEEMKALAEKISTTSVTIEVKVNDEGHLYGSIAPAMIAEAFAKQGLAVDADAIELEQPIKEVGVFAIKVRLLPEVQAEGKIWVVQSPGEKS